MRFARRYNFAWHARVTRCASRAIPLAAAFLLLAGDAGAAPLSDRAALLAQWDQPPTAPVVAWNDKASWSPLELAVDVTNAAQPPAQPVPADPAHKRAGGRKALLLSLLLPGAGEMYLGERGRATGFFIAEGAIWTHFVWFQVAGHLRKDNYIEQARRHAGVGVSDADDSYWKLLGQYKTSRGTGADAYEETLRREARDTYPGDPAAQDAWVAERLPSGDRAWVWSSTDARDAYRETRESSRRAYDRSKYSIAAAIVNRILSAIDTQIIRRKLSRATAGDQSLRPEHSQPPDPTLLLLSDTAPDGSARLYLTRSF